MRRKFHHAIILPSLCCISFYIGIHIVGETEASFTSQVSPEPMEISAAFVFPAIIEQLEGDAEEIANNAASKYEIITNDFHDAVLPELYTRLAEIEECEQELRIQLNQLQSIYNELFAYQRKIQSYEESDTLTFHYVRDGYQHVKRIMEDGQAAIDFQEIETIRSSLQSQINELEREKSIQADHQENTKSLDETEGLNQAATNSNNLKQVTENGQENF
ncbi:hypothetical protein AF332_03620 [Sporosarcina globispora]|uniref:Uncharacterized protein n=1 Tax=Sporosarcina globispora TaxID=1459 RepID=A0A0M0G8A5_SPOGL|nr:DUF4047 domain-containing protein [Sporosarcina globispora]KON85988.1 hypothetical protein AF332_03620 [Sporosarcina globispora]